MTAKSKEVVSEAAQTAFRDSESQFLEWDITKNPSQHPSNFPRGRGLWYPILYNPAWPVHIAAKKRDQKLPPAPKHKSVVGSYALTGMTASELQRRPIKKTLIFPHRNTDLPFRQPTSKVVREPVYEPCETLTLTAVEELESIVVTNSIFDRIPWYNKNDKNARELAIRKAFHLGPSSVVDPGPPIPRRRIKRRKSKLKAKDEPKAGEVGGKPQETLFMNEGLHCRIHGATIDIPIVKNCQIHGDSGIIVDGEKVVSNE